MTEPPPGNAEEQCRLLMECVTDQAIFFLNPQGLVSGWNVGAERLLGYPEAEVAGCPGSLFFTPEDIMAGAPEKELQAAIAASHACALAPVCTQGGGAGDDRWQVRKDGSRFWASGVVTALRDDQGNLRGFAKILRDRTEQRRAEEASERRYRALVENAFDGITLVAADGRILETTSLTFRGLGYSPEEYVGRDAFELLHPDDAQAVRTLLDRVLSEPGGKAAAQYRLRHSDGTYRWVEAVGTNMLDDPAVRAVVVNHRDVTEQKEADRRKDQWISMLAHELRGPLSPVSSAVQVLFLKGAADPEVEHARDVIARQTRHLAQIVDDLLEVTRLFRGQLQLRKERLDLARLVKTAVEDHRLALEGAGLTLSLEIPQTPLWVTGDVTRLSQVIGNLLDNAMKFRNGGSSVKVEVRADLGHAQAVLVVRDRGVGIEPQLLPVLFDVFAQADRSLHRTGGGLGLGLSLVRGLVQLHGGEVRAASAGPGQGAEFTVLLPLEKEPAALSGQAATPSPSRRPLRILVVEDNRDAADSLQVLLTLLGHEVRVAYTGPEGISAAIAWAPEVILSDIGLPGLDGYGVASELRRNPATANARLIAITGYGSEEDRRRALQSGFDYHLTKPADPAELERLLGGTAS